MKFFIWASCDNLLIYLFAGKNNTHIIQHFAKGKRTLFQCCFDDNKICNRLNARTTKDCQVSTESMHSFRATTVIEDKKIERFLLQCSLRKMGQYKYFLWWGFRHARLRSYLVFQMNESIHMVGKGRNVTNNSKSLRTKEISLSIVLYCWSVSFDTNGSDNQHKTF